MADQEIYRDEDASGTSRCGFRRCRQPLPPPGPRGGRPYEFCPERVWPGGKSCKQLAAAEQALREALGEEAVPTAALREAGEAFGGAAVAVLEPLRTLSNALEAVTVRLREDVAAAATRAATAELAATEADTRRAEALATAAEAEQAAHDAVAEARAAEQAQALAETSAKEAIAARSAAQLDQARAEAAAAAIAEQAQQAAADAAAQRARVDELAAQVSARTEELSARTAERDAARDALEELQRHSKAWEQSLTSKNAELVTELDTARARLRESEDRHRTLIAEHHLRNGELHTRIGDTQAELASATGRLDAARAQLTQMTGRHGQVTEVLSRVRRRALDAAAEPQTPLRDDLLAILLGDNDNDNDSGDAVPG